MNDQITKNDFFEYYGKHNISPVSQDINDISLHYERRRKLYRQCGLPELAFKNAKILEVGPGSGYNSLYFLNLISTTWGGGGHLDLVEANPSGLRDMKKLFETRKIDKNLYDIHETPIEGFVAEKKYDIIVAEGFLQNLQNQDEVINKLKSLVAKRGVIVVTCEDDAGRFIEAMKRLLAHIITRDVLDFSEKVKYLTQRFEPQLKKLRGVSRPAKDWVEDQILDLPGANGQSLSLSEAIEKFGEDYFVLGASPSMFTDYSWYKDVWVNQREHFIEEFNEKRMTLLLAGSEEVKLSADDADMLIKYFVKLKGLANLYEKNYNEDTLNEVAYNLNNLSEKAKILPEDFRQILEEIIKALNVARTGTISDLNWEEYTHFFGAFGRSMQYIAFEKR